MPPNICICDLQGLVSEVNATTIFIPHNPVNYKPLKYAFMYFKNEEDFNVAMNNIYEFNGHQLEWSTSDEKSGHRCSYTGHIAHFCVDKSEIFKSKLTFTTIPKQKLIKNQFVCRCNSKLTKFQA